MDNVGAMAIGYAMFGSLEVSKASMSAVEIEIDINAPVPANCAEAVVPSDDKHTIRDYCI